MLRWGVTKLGKPRSDVSDVIASFSSSFTGLNQASRMGIQEAEILQRPALGLDLSARSVYRVYHHLPFDGKVLYQELCLRIVYRHRMDHEDIEVVEGASPRINDLLLDT